jgi:hypothetical protein
MGNIIAFITFSKPKANSLRIIFVLILHVKESSNMDLVKVYVDSRRRNRIV